MTAAEPIMSEHRKVTRQIPPPLEDLLAAQKKAFLQNPNPSYQERVDRLKALKKALLSNKDALLSALDEDFGGRSGSESSLTEIIPNLGNIHYTIKQLKKWMQPSKRKLNPQLLPASAKVVYQPLGVVGIVVPFNYPLFLSLSPLLTILAAGNRAMIKMSEFTPKTSELVARIIEQTFPANLVTVVCGDAQVATEFTGLHFDHMIFTGSTAVGRHVMGAAAKNLTPVTLELGGKSPVILDNDFPIQEAAERVCYAKALNAGQTCVAPDYILVKNDQKAAFIEHYLNAFRKMYPRVNGNNDYTSIINDRHHQRLLKLLADAKAQGATIHTPGNEEINDGSRRIPIHLIENPTDNMGIMQEEIFGPLLPVIGIDSLDEAIQFVQQRPRPLALYYFGSDTNNQETVLAQTHSGGVCINECLLHVAVEDMPFGGIGPSGMGHYHGHEGFLTFSKAKSVLTKGKLNSTKMIYPPYGGWLQKKMLKFLSGRQ
ncbi:coniferyl aldehyde dehydrogenase [Thalassotalea sp. G20_0]|uniref:coniferyl aldehyde dehydrogenase n=1 Tax=Thalassotalea sp. G20_0 TaxID=2821093 RepID=UPI001ADBFFBB|nr:coniferyl aldehyde dehydrogenase [Thalassotalea sp. G20_0]MBO9495201.1 coniferyl aldehyde dehydrogenase [Thalassotalea sp. G20_0]